MAKLGSLNAETVAKQIINLLLPFKDVVKTITLDNGKEFACFKEIEKKLDTQIYFTHPNAEYEKGLVENTNMLIRQYFPKGCSLRKVNYEEVKRVNDLLNHRPRKTLNYTTPYEVFFSNFEANKKIALDS